jgi:hypothetical protein
MGNRGKGFGLRARRISYCIFLFQQSPAVGSALVSLADLRGSFKEGGCVAEIWAVLHL